MLRPVGLPQSLAFNTRRSTDRQRRCGEEIYYSYWTANNPGRRCRATDRLRKGRDYGSNDCYIGDRSAETSPMCWRGLSYRSLTSRSTRYGTAIRRSDRKQGVREASSTTRGQWSSSQSASPGSFRIILVGASGGSASDGAIELACRFADRLRAHVEGFHVLLNPMAVFASVGAGEGLALSGDVVAEMIDDADANAAKAKSSFAEIATRHHLPDQGIAQMAVAGTPGLRSAGARNRRLPKLIAERARFFDLVVLGRSSRVVDEPSSNTIEAVLARSGRPVLLAPAETPADMANLSRSR